MDSQRNILLIALMFVSFMLYLNWTEATNPQPQGQGVTQQAQHSGDVPASADANAPLTQDKVSDKLITLQSDVLTLTVDTHGGDIVRAQLNDYDAELDSEAKFVLLKNQPNHVFEAQSGLIGSNGIDTVSGRAQYTTDGTDFVMGKDQNELRVPMTVVKDGITYTKTFILKRDSYAVDVDYTINNQSDKPASVQMYAQLKQNLMDDGGSLTMPTYRGGVYSADESKYEKYSFDDMKDRNLNLTITKDGWAGMMQHYFVAAWIPHATGDVNLYTRTSDGLGFIGVRYPTTTVEPGKEVTLDSTLWVGPKLQDQMAKVAPNLNLTVDYGWLWFIASHCTGCCRLSTVLWVTGV